VCKMTLTVVSISLPGVSRRVRRLRHHIVGKKVSYATRQESGLAQGVLI